MLSAKGGLLIRKFVVHQVWRWRESREGLLPHVKARNGLKLVTIQEVWQRECLGMTHEKLKREP